MPLAMIWLSRKTGMWRPSRRHSFAERTDERYVSGYACATQHRNVHEHETSVREAKRIAATGIRGAGEDEEENNRRKRKQDRPGH